jgi:hypothetical protein
MNPLAKLTTLTWGLKHEALNTIYKGGILPLMCTSMDRYYGKEMQ